MRVMALLLLACSSGVMAQPSDNPAVDDLERDDSLALSVAWRLQVGNARFCPT